MKNLWFVFVAVLTITGLAGYIWNVIKLVQNDFVITSGLSIGRVLGVFLAPLGAILGFI